MGLSGPTIITIISTTTATPTTNATTTAAAATTAIYVYKLYKCLGVSALPGAPLVPAVARRARFSPF